MTEHETKIINASIKSYKSMIKYFREQIFTLERKKLKIQKDCPECIRLPIANKREDRK